jgi:hypothetical protein
MNTRSKGNLKMLMEKHREPCISMYLPTHQVGPEIQQDRIRLKNQTRQAENLLFLANVHAAEMENLLEPVQALVADEPFWLHPSEGLALFRSQDVFDPYRLPFSFQELVVVSTHFSAMMGAFISWHSPKTPSDCLRVHTSAFMKLSCQRPFLSACPRSSAMTGLIISSSTRAVRQAHQWEKGAGQL